MQSLKNVCFLVLGLITPEQKLDLLKKAKISAPYKWRPRPYNLSSTLGSTLIRPGPYSQIRSHAASPSTGMVVFISK